VTEPERMAVSAPPLFDRFRERRTRGQRRRAVMHRVYSAIAAIRRRLGGDR